MFDKIAVHRDTLCIFLLELEPISGNIAKQLYPDAQIEVTGFENTCYPDQFFDVVIGNIPFHSISIDDPKYNRYHFRCSIK